MASTTIPTVDRASPSTPRYWLERLWSSIADRGRAHADVLQPQAASVGLTRVKELAHALLSERGEASGAAIARELNAVMAELGEDDRLTFYHFMASNFLPSEQRLRAAAEA